MKQGHTARPDMLTIEAGAQHVHLHNKAPLCLMHMAQNGSTVIQTQNQSLTPHSMILNYHIGSVPWMQTPFAAITIKTICNMLWHSKMKASCAWMTSWLSMQMS